MDRVLAAQPASKSASPTIAKENFITRLFYGIVGRPNTPEIQTMKADILLIAKTGVQTPWLDCYTNINNKAHKAQVVALFDQLSAGAKTAIAQKVWENNGSLPNVEDNYGENFLRNNPLNEPIRKAFRIVLEQSMHEISGYRGTTWIKIRLYATTLLQIIGSTVRSFVCCRPFRAAKEA